MASLLSGVGAEQSRQSHGRQSHGRQSDGRQNHGPDQNAAGCSSVEPSAAATGAEDTRRRRGRAALLSVAAVAAALTLSGCAQNSAENEALGINDPYENINRDFHEFNKGADRLVLRPIARGYRDYTPDALQFVFRNVINHFELPRDFVNHILTGEFKSAGRTLLRAGINSTFGFGGIFDPASDVEIFKEDSDFGKTLAVWGVPQGVYFELPLLGPTSPRHSVGNVVDIAFSPTTYFGQPFAGISRGAVDIVDSRARNAELSMTSSTIRRIAMR